MSPRILAIIPCYNEALSIPALLQEFSGLSLKVDPLVVDDGSQDNTTDVASTLATVVRLPLNLGIGGAVQTGIIYAHQNNYDYCVQVDGDGQHRPDQIERLLAHQQQNNADIVIGSRFLGEKSFRTTFARRAGISLLQFTLQMLYRTEVTDPTSGFRLMNRRAITLFAQEYPQDFPEPISIGMALNQGQTVSEVAVKMRAREHGESSISGLKSLSYILRVVGYLTMMKAGRHF